MARTKQSARKTPGLPGGKAPRKQLTAKSVRKTNVAGAAKKHSTRPKKALHEILKLNKRNKSFIPKSQFVRLVREILSGITGGADLKIQKVAMLTLQIFHENFLIEIFTNSYKITVHAHRLTLFASDVMLASSFLMRNYNLPPA